MNQGQSYNNDFKEFRTQSLKCFMLRLRVLPVNVHQFFWIWIRVFFQFQYPSIDFYIFLSRFLGHDNVANCAIFIAALWETDDILAGDLVVVGTGLVTPAVH